MAARKKTFIAKVMLKGNPDKIPDFGLGKGVIAEVELTYTDKTGRGFGNDLFRATMLAHERSLMAQVVEVKFVPKTKKAKRGKK